MQLVFAQLIKTGGSKHNKSQPNAVINKFRLFTL